MSHDGGKNTVVHHPDLFLFPTSFQGLEGVFFCIFYWSNMRKTHLFSPEFPAGASLKAATSLIRLWFLFKQQISGISLPE